MSLSCEQLGSLCVGASNARMLLDAYTLLGANPQFGYANSYRGRGMRMIKRYLISGAPKDNRQRQTEEATGKKPRRGPPTNGRQTRPKLVFPQPARGRGQSRLHGHFGSPILLEAYAAKNQSPLCAALSLVLPPSTQVTNKYRTNLQAQLENELMNHQEVHDNEIKCS